MTPEQEQFAVDLSDSAKSHADWLNIVRFGLQTLLESQTLFIEIIWREAAQQVARRDASSAVASDEVRRIFEELGLKFVMA